MRAFARVLGALMASGLIAIVTVSLVNASPSDMTIARANSARFNSLDRATAAGYGLLPEGAPLHECIASLDPSVPGAMGFHYINGGLLDDKLDPANPEALVYAPDGHGKMRLVALEYVIFDADWGSSTVAPTMFGGVSLLHTDAPNRYDIPAFWALHVWLWDDNPAGIYKPFNPDVSC